VTVTAGTATAAELRILSIEDVEDDFILLRREVERAGYKLVGKRVDSEAGLREALTERWDVVIADYSVPALQFETVLALVKARLPDVPFFLVSGSIGEERAVAALKAGAADFVLKDRMGRLVPAIERELREARTRSERARLREQLTLSDRLATVGTLAGGIAHEINNPLAVALGNVEYALTTVAALERGAAPPIGSDLREPLVDARDALARVRDIVRDVKMFSRSGDPSRRGTVDVRQVLRSAMRMTWNEARHRARITEEFADVPAVDGNDSRLGQAFLNVLVNAIQALPEGRATNHRITVRTSTDAHGWAVVAIEDTGKGIAAGDIPRVFEPFFTTKPPQVGTGLGLAIAHAIVSETGGTIHVASEVGKGTTVTFRLPPGQPLDPSTTMPITRPASAVRGRILVVDDEPMLGAVVRRALAQEHDVTVVTSSRDALGAMVGAKFDVILCDVMMPDIDGTALYWMIDPVDRRRIVFVTGGAFSPEVRAFLDDVPNPRLDKPFDPEHLRRVVRDMVRGASSTSGTQPPPFGAPG
jgi:signal transduction histidine kinase